MGKMDTVAKKFIAAILLILCLPVFIILYLLVKLDSPGPFIFRQKRTGKNRKTFTIFKIRTMIVGAEDLQKKYKKYNEADGPVFKINNDPRFTKVGRYLSRAGLDELPQLINILKGEMSFVGPRPLPFNEAKKLFSRYGKRFTVLPGLTSSWVISGAHDLTFKKWMQLDLKDVRNHSLKDKLVIIFKTLKGVTKIVFK